jgi:hypothetical protein
MRLAEDGLPDSIGTIESSSRTISLFTDPGFFSISALHQKVIRLSNTNMLCSLTAVSAAGRPERVWQL